MAKVQIARTEASRVAATIQIARTAASTPTVTATQKVQITRTEVTTGGVSTAPVITASSVPTGTVYWPDDVNMSVTVSGSFNQVVWVQQETEAPIVPLVGSDTAKTFTPVADPDGGDYRWAVTATGPGGTSDPVFLQVLVGSHVDYFHDGTSWVPCMLPVAL